MNFDFEKILKEGKGLNIEKMQKRLILIALIRSDFVIPRAYKLNCCTTKSSSMSFDAYDKLFRKFYPCGSVILKDKWLNYVKEKKSNSSKRTPSDEKSL